MRGTYEPRPVLATCLHCQSQWQSHRTEHCTAVTPSGQRCCQSFSTTRNGDAHRRPLPSGKRVCVDPASVGLELSVKGVWKSPGPVNGVAVVLQRSDTQPPGQRKRTPEYPEAPSVP